MGVHIGENGTYVGCLNGDLKKSGAGCTLGNSVFEGEYEKERGMELGLSPTLLDSTSGKL